MAGNRDMRALIRLVVLCAMTAFFALPSWAQGPAREHAQEQVQRQETQPLNNAPVWRDVRSSDTPSYQTSQVRGVETTVLVQSQGEIWRQIRNGPITVYGGWLILAICAVIAAIYLILGPIKMGKPTGRLMERFNSIERVTHWTVAISFCLLGVTGLIILFGKYVVLPIFGYTLFSWLAILSKNVHNFVAPVFVVSLVLFIVIYVKDNLPEKGDGRWLVRGYRMFLGEHMPSGRFNAGEKVWFWLGVVALCLIVSASGAILLFPNFEQGRLLMQQANVIHAISAVLVIGFSLGHIYMGTIGVEGAYGNMRTGYADETWAKEHHEYWYNEAKGRGAVAGGTPTHAHASAMKEGWK